MYWLHIINTIYYIILLFIIGCLFFIYYIIYQIIILYYISIKVIIFTYILLTIFLYRNNALPKFHQITHDELELDLRITVDLNKELEMEMIAVRGRLAFKVEKSELELQKLLEHFIHPITCLPFTVCKIS